MTRNIVVFGQTGAGKSSIINMLAESPVAKTSDDLYGATSSNQKHIIGRQDGYTYKFWDTPGLNESEHGTRPSKAAAQSLQKLVTNRPIDLFIYCIRDRLVDMIRVNYELVSKILRKRGVPIVLVVTGLELRDMDKWWGENEETLKTMKMSFDGHACITSWKGINNMFEKKYAESTEKVWILVMEHCGLRHNVIVFGDLGCGKSSLVNMIFGKNVAKVSPGGCTLENEAYKSLIDDKLFVIYDTAGLNEGGQSHWKAIQKIYTLIRELESVSLLVFCMREWRRENAQAKLFHEVICGGKVPIIVIVTGLDAYRNSDDWWKSGDQRKEFEANGVVPNAVGCVVSSPGPNGEYKDVYRESRAKLRRLIIKHHLQKPWGGEEKEEKWFAKLYQSSPWNFFRNKEYSQQMQDIIGQNIQESKMRKEDAKKLKATLLKAEKEFKPKKRRK